MHVLIAQSVNRMAPPAFWLAIGDLSTRSSTLAVFAVLGLIGLAVLGVLYYRKSQLQGAVDCAVSRIPRAGRGAHGSDR